MRHFFLSTADGEDPLVKEFFDDLCEEVRQYAGRARDEPVGFLDHQSHQMGEVWPSALIGALQTCRTFIALCSPRYFHSASCGREWGVFAARLAADPAATRHLPGLIPLIWLATSPVPAPLRDLQFADASFGAAYHEHGLRRLLQIRRHRDDYLEFLTAVAARITTTAPTCDPPPLNPPPDLATAPDAFHTGHDVPAPRTAARPPRNQRPTPAKLPLLAYEETFDDDGHR